MQPSGPPQPPRYPILGSTAPPQNMGPPMPMQFRPAGPPQQPSQFIQLPPQQFRPVGQAMPGANVGMPGSMPHFPQPGQHIPHSGHVPPASQAVRTVYQADRPMSLVPMHPQQQAVFRGGHMATMGACMPPHNFQCQPTSVPPVAQPRGTAPGQSIPLVPLVVQPWHQSVSASSFAIATVQVSSTEPSSCDWQEHTSQAGKKYYYNKRTRQSSWKKPAELMTPLERADASTEWKEFTTAEGQKYYYNKLTNESKWSIPDELKVAREQAEKALIQQPDRVTETTASAPVGSTSVPFSSEVGIIASSTHDRISNLPLPPVNGLSYNAGITSSYVMQTGGTSNAVVAPVTATTGVSSVATDSGTSRNESSSQTIITDTKTGASAEDLEEAKKTMPTAGKIVIPLEEKRSEEPVTSANKLEARNAFKALLESVNLESDWPWDRAMRVIINDKRYSALKTLGERKQAYNEYLNQRKKIEAEERRVKQRKARDDFLTMLEECKGLTSSTRWGKAITMFEDDKRFSAVEHPRDREDLFEYFLVDLQKKERAKAAEEHKRHVVEYRVFLESCGFIKANTQWRKVQDRLEDDEHCSRLEKIDRLDIFQEYIWDLEEKEEEQKWIQKEQARRQERKNRHEFRKMLDEHVADGTLTAKTHWRDYCAQVKDSCAYLAVASNTSDSMPKELFEDVMEELQEQYQDDKTLIKDEVKCGKIHMTTSWTLVDFQAAVTEDENCKGISNINIKLIYDDLIGRLREKNLKEAKKRQRLGDNFLDLLYSIKEISATSTWDDSKPLFEDSQDYMALDSDTYARELFEECVIHLKERLKEKKRMRGRKGNAKKEKECEERKKKKEIENEKKEKERKEKERERGKKREKDRSKRDEMEIDGSDVDIRRSKYKRRGKDKKKKQKRRNDDTTDDVSSEGNEKDDLKKSKRHSRDRKKSWKA
ncbi:hypothetical protein BRADI_4g20404v3 [Brachypodium distachyon]|uniref:Pre-mRNA-processing protein 40A n=1 Tax=Brachypodium distachyon TaxID=15368 RepID=A0A2K2CNY1_BRADI|nr:hypothetical protein BRADI_4g20404v3 [Brachypodium distachyon]